ncbi:hypothetical protein KsCSTR_26540 [Candidatus Kuenenia stuttgartiensis]|uniref:Uncharacterized protein n=1 Tax=Kuenenia stuttgartiensis TaxID=174633 RepID=A0A6G7GRT7_KUEST|nr:hypothetical protein KsCSTR_26540 [Candidatus Kuenenia stuttgartiensis]
MAEKPQKENLLEYFIIKQLLITCRYSASITFLNNMVSIIL